MNDAAFLEAYRKHRKEHPFLFIYDTLFEILSLSIVSLELLPHSVLSDSHIASLLKISRTPVRQAFDLLKNGGLLVYENNMYVVAEYTVEDFRQYMELRMIIEPAMAHMACEHATDRDIAELKILAQRFDGLSSDISSYRQQHQMENDFHEKICSMCGNIHLQEIYRSTKLQRSRAWFYSSRLFENATVSVKRDTTYHNSHYPIYYSISIRNGRMALDAMYSHLQNISYTGV